MNDKINHDRQTRFSDNYNDWSKYLDKKIYYPFNEEIIHGVSVIIIVNFNVNEDGMVENVYTSTTFSEKFDRESENAIKESPQWDAAIEHNRKVKFNF